MKKPLIFCILFLATLALNAQTVIWSDDFSNPSNWIATQQSGTTLFVIGTNGPAGQYSSAMGKIRSSSNANNFALYDADPYVGSLGKRAHLRTANSINTLGHSNIVLEFEQYFQGQNTEKTWVQFSTNGTTFTDSILVNPTNGPTANPQIVRIDISAIAGNKPAIWLRFTYNGNAGYAWMIDDVKIKTNVGNDASVKEIFTYGTLPKTYGNGHIIGAVIRNEGSNNLTNLNVSLSITGANTFSNSQTIASLPAKSQDTVFFAAFNPANTGNNTITVSLPNDNDNTNNSKTITQTISTNTFNVAYGNTADRSTGLNGAAGQLLVKYSTAAPLIISHVNVRIEDAQSVGKSVSAVLLDANGNTLAQSASYTIAAGDIGTYKAFELTQFPIIAANQSFYVGLNLPAATGFKPVGYQFESPTRENAFYSKTTIGNITSVIDKGRLMIGATLSDTIPDLTITAVVSPVNACTHSAQEQVTITLKNNSYRTLPVGTQIPVKLNIQPGNQNISETFTLNQALQPMQSVNYTFTSTANLSTSLTDYTIKAICSYALDTKRNNDTLQVVVSTYETPANFSLGQDVYVCGNSNTTLTAPAISGCTYLWKKGTTTLSETSNTLTVTPSMGSGNYSVIITNSHNCSASDEILVSFNQLPVAELGARDTSVCPNAFFTLNVGSFQGCTYRWFETSNPSVTLSTTTSFNVRKSGTYVVLIEDPNCQTSATDTMTVNLPVLDLGEDIITCNSSWTLDAGYFPGFFYTWRKNTSATTIGTSQTKTVTETAYYNVTIMNAECGSIRDTIHVTFTTNPNINLGPDITSCDVATQTLDAGSYPGFSYLWTNTASGDTVSQSQQAVITQSGTYQVKLYTNGGCNATDVIAVVLSTTPVVDLGADTIDITGLPGVYLVAPEGYSYTWYHEGQQLSETNDSLYVELATGGDGWYSVVVNNNGCTAQDSVFIAFIVNINTVKSSDVRVEYFPNPFNNQFFLNVSEIPGELSICDISGRIVLKQAINSQHSIICVPSAEKGLYLLQYRTKNSLRNGKVEIK